MDEAKPQRRSYHHGDLSRALIDAARELIEADGPAAISLRGVARRAGVSAAAPYHHFKDKAELLHAVAREGWHSLAVALNAAREAAPLGRGRVTAVGVAYVTFALEHPALYQVMYEDARIAADLPDQTHDPEQGAFATVRRTLVDVAGEPDSRIDLEMATIAAWCAAHGLAELARFSKFDGLKAALGGERPFLRAVFEHLAPVPQPLKA